MSALLEVKELSVSYPGFCLHPLSFTLDRGEILAVVGGSGAGKTTLLQGLACLTQAPGQVRGQVLLDGEDLIAMEEKRRRALRMEKFSLAFQSSASRLNPSMDLAGQLKELLCRRYPKAEHRERMEGLMALVGLQPEDLGRYPRELSGGMVQKFLLAMALALEPELLLLDEPSSSLDLAAREELAELICRLRRDRGAAFLLVTHDLSLARAVSDRMLVLYNGHVEELGPTKALLQDPRHPYTRGLIGSSAGLNIARDLWGIRPPRREAEGHGCPFYGRCTQSLPLCAHTAPALKEQGGRLLACNRGGIVTLLEGRGLGKAYGARQVLRGVDIEIRSGEVVALVGRSGSGKTTLARLLAGYMEKPWEGRLLFQGKEAAMDLLHRSLGGVQMVFQDSSASLDGHMSVFKAAAEPGTLSKLQDVRERVLKALDDVGLDTGEAFLKKPVATLSGGQKQRLDMARALTMEPSVLLADEPSSMLDPSGKAELLRLLKGLQNSRGFSMLLVTHDLESALKVADRCLLLKDGRLQALDTGRYVHCSLPDMLSGL